MIALGFVSLFTDMSSEMAYTQIPLFLTGVLGASAISVGLIEGIAESTASLLRIVSGYWSDRSGQRKPLTLLGYSLGAISKPLMALAYAPLFVLLLRFVDRFGKGSAHGSPRRPDYGNHAARAARASLRPAPGNGHDGSGSRSASGDLVPSAGSRIMDTVAIWATICACCSFLPVCPVCWRC